LFCFEHGRPTTDYAGATIFCDRDERDGHVLARDFPFADDWEYCCDCECFYTLEQARKVRAAEGQDAARCPACGRQSIRHYLCAGCKVISHKSGEKVHAVYSIKATGLVHPTCPGCLKPTSSPVQEHECHLLGLGYTTSRASCPFCKLVISPDAPAAVVREVPARGGEAAAAAAPTAAEPAPPAPAPRPAAPQPAKPNAARSTTAERSVPAAQSTLAARASDAGRVAKGYPIPADASGKRTTTPQKATASQQQPTDSDRPKWHNARRALLSVSVIILLLAASAALYLYLDRYTQPPVIQESRLMSVADAQKAVDAAKSKLVPRERLQQASDELNEVRRKTNTLKTKWEMLRGDTLRAGKDPDDPVKSPRTTGARKDYEVARVEEGERSKEYAELTTQNNKAREDLRVAEDALAAAKARSLDTVGQAQPAPEAIQDEGMLAAVAAWLPVSLVALAAIISCVLVIWVWKLNREDDETVDDMYLRVRRLQKQSDGLMWRVHELESSLSGLKDVPDKLAQLQDDAAKVRDVLRNARRAEPAAQSPQSVTHKDGGTAAVRFYRDSDVGAPAYEETVDFPISAESFLSRISGQRQMPIRHDPLRDILVKDEDGVGLLMLVRDGSVYGGQLCMVPGMTRLNTVQEFYYNYNPFYDCECPSAGYVWINKPALVVKVDGGWKLLEKGVLEIKC
jgi:hypothetical protein